MGECGAMNRCQPHTKTSPGISSRRQQSLAEVWEIPGLEGGEFFHRFFSGAIFLAKIFEAPTLEKFTDNVKKFFTARPPSLRGSVVRARLNQRTFQLGPCKKYPNPKKNIAKKKYQPIKTTNKRLRDARQRL